MDANQYRQEVLNDLMKNHGHMIGMRHLYRVMGFPTYDALKQCLLRKQLDLNLFYLDGRKGRYAMTSDVADWLAAQWVKTRPAKVSNGTSVP